MELIGDRKFDEANRAGVGAKSPERSSGFDVEDLDEAGEVGGGDEEAIAAEGCGGDDVV